MSSLDLKSLRHVAHLARIKLTPSEEKTFLPQLSSVIDYFKILKKADTKNVKPSFQATDISNVARKDVVTPSLPLEQVLSPSSDTKDNYFRVKSTISK
tara:strand:- start:451 stop:744 length:294 start_codon:yes stop_codon:yes gene_type:complete